MSLKFGAARDPEAPSTLWLVDPHESVVSTLLGLKLFASEALTLTPDHTWTLNNLPF